MTIKRAPFLLGTVTSIHPLVLSVVRARRTGAPIELLALHPRQSGESSDTAIASVIKNSIKPQLSQGRLPVLTGVPLVQVMLTFILTEAQFRTSAIRVTSWAATRLMLRASILRSQPKLVARVPRLGELPNLRL